MTADSWVLAEWPTEKAKGCDVILLVAGQEIRLRPQSLSHQLGLMFFPWLAQAGHSHPDFRGGWALMENRCQPPAYQARWSPCIGDCIQDYATAAAAMEQFNAMVKAGVFRVRVPLAAAAA